MKYINKRGDIIDAAEYDGTEESLTEIERMLGFTLRIDPVGFAMLWRDEILKTDKISPLDCVFYISPVTEMPNYGLAASFKRQFKPISDARVLMVEELKKDMLLALREDQKDGKLDDWRKLGLSVLYQRLLAEESWLRFELKKIELGDLIADFDAARKKCADAANCAAMIHDSLNGMELETMHKRKEKDEL